MQTNAKDSAQRVPDTDDAAAKRAGCACDAIGFRPEGEVRRWKWSHYSPIVLSLSLKLLALCIIRL